MRKVWFPRGIIHQLVTSLNGFVRSISMLSACPKVQTETCGEYFWGKYWCPFNQTRDGRTRIRTSVPQVGHDSGFRNNVCLMSFYCQRTFFDCSDTEVSLNDKWIKNDHRLFFLEFFQVLVLNPRFFLSFNCCCSDVFCCNIDFYTWYAPMWLSHDFLIDIPMLKLVIGTQFQWLSKFLHDLWISFSPMGQITCHNLLRFYVNNALALIWSYSFIDNYN